MGARLAEGGALNDIELLADAARVAGEIGLSYFGKSPEVWIKGKDSPVSEADIAIDCYLKERLLAVRPDYGWLSEETEDSPARLAARRLFVIDPIDGTRGFLQGTENWTVSLAIVEAGRPTEAVLFGPVVERLYKAEAGCGATCNDRPISPSASDLLSEGEFAIPARVSEHIQNRLCGSMSRARHIHSLAYRIALVADGGLSGTIARPSAQDWDIAAADLILEEAGGALLRLDGEKPLYNQPSTRHDWLLASGPAVRSSLKNALIEAIEEQA
ncbi:MAG: 3'(2'),5'-bisphosphate nucleotidase CysQ [Rhizobiales bacterium]|nr:3'(2'),5'-bisphosphate nucleotidase CysQ [Hyphomicrobiales bacterium]